MKYRKQARLICRIAAIACLFAFILPGYTDDCAPDSQMTRMRLGLPFSPWLQWQREKRTERGPETVPGADFLSTSINSKWGIDVLSWSVLALVAGAAFFAVANFLREPSPQSSK